MGEYKAGFSINEAADKKQKALVLADKSDLKDSPRGGCRACYPVARIV